MSDLPSNSLREGATYLYEVVSEEPLMQTTLKSRLPILKSKGEPCKQGETSARSGCIPASGAVSAGSGGSKKPASAPMLQLLRGKEPALAGLVADLVDAGKLDPKDRAPAFRKLAQVWDAAMAANHSDVKIAQKIVNNAIAAQFAAAKKPAAQPAAQSAAQPAAPKPPSGQKLDVPSLMKRGLKLTSLRAQQVAFLNPHGPVNGKYIVPKSVFGNPAAMAKLKELLPTGTEIIGMKWEKAEARMKALIAAGKAPKADIELAKGIALGLDAEDKAKLKAAIPLISAALRVADVAKAAIGPDYLADQQKLASATPTGKKPLNGGQMNDTYKVTFADGTHGVFKVDGTGGQQKRVAKALIGPNEVQYIREAAASDVAAVLGVELVPPTIIRDIDGKTGSVQRFVPAEGARNVRQSEMFGTPESLAKAAAFDFVVGNIDRHPGNWMVKKSGELVLIDNGFAFPTQRGACNHSMLFGKAAKDGVPIPSYVKQWKWEGVEAAMRKHGLTGTELESAKARFEALQKYNNFGEVASSAKYPPPPVRMHGDPW